MRHQLANKILSSQFFSPQIHSVYSNWSPIGRKRNPIFHVVAFFKSPFGNIRPLNMVELVNNLLYLLHLQQNSDRSQSYLIVLGPVAATFVDFWSMVWQQNSDRIAMVTNLEESGKVNLSTYNCWLWCVCLEILPWRYFPRTLPPPSPSYSDRVSSTVRVSTSFKKIPRLVVG